MTNASDYYGMGVPGPTAEDFLVSQITPPSLEGGAGLAEGRPETNIGVAPYAPPTPTPQPYALGPELDYLFQTPSDYYGMGPPPAVNFTQPAP